MDRQDALRLRRAFSLLSSLTQVVQRSYELVGLDRSPSVYLF